MFFVAKRAVVESVPFDEDTFDGFHGYDLDFSLAAITRQLRAAAPREP